MHDPELLSKDIYYAGNYIRIKHIDSLYDNIYSYYEHLLIVFVGQGDKVKRGQLIGKCGSSGRKPVEPHLHFELHNRDWSPINPYRNINNPNSRCYWTKDNDPQYP
ncbi:M23 family metallopeptidase [Candidatus Bathyarchaeota archaeon]|nr:M23 family metallopeptidase [Candidatus Bathyarchaeota archaeon]